MAASTATIIPAVLLLNDFLALLPGEKRQGSLSVSISMPLWRLNVQGLTLKPVRAGQDSLIIDIMLSIGCHICLKCLNLRLKNTVDDERQ